MRTLVPLALIAAGVGVYVYSHTSDDGVIAFFFLDSIESLRGNRLAQADVSAGFLVVLGVLTLLRELIRRRQDDD